MALGIMPKATIAEGERGNYKKRPVGHFPVAWELSYTTEHVKTKSNQEIEPSSQSRCGPPLNC